MTQFSLEPLYGSIWVTALLAAAVVAVIAWVTPPTEDPSQRKWLVSLRSFAALVLLVAAFRPTLIRTDNAPAPATLMISIDTSRSMSLPDGEGQARWETQALAVRDLLAGIADLDEMLDVQLLAYDEDSRPLGQASDSPAVSGLISKLDAESPDGDATDLGDGLRGAIESAGGKPLAGVVLLGDGTHTATDMGEGTPGDGVAARRSAEVLDALGVPLWTVTIGPPSSDTSARDLAVSGLPDSFSLFAGNQFDCSFAIEAAGLANIKVPVRVSWIAEDGSRTEALTRNLVPAIGRETVAMSESLDAPVPGIYRLEVAVEPQPGEWVTSNNTQTAFVEVREGGGRILVLEGPGRPEQTFIRRALGGFPDLQLQYAPIRSDRSWPVDLRSAFEPGKFDIYVLGDLDSEALGESQLQTLSKRIGEGAGLITLGGMQVYGVGGYADGPLADVLPVKMDAGRRRPAVMGVMTPAERAARSGAELNGPFKVVPTMSHPVLQLGSGDLGTVWKSLPELTGAYRFAGKRTASGVQVLLESPNKQPLLVIGSYGKGRVASLGLDETYRWWRGGKSDLHRRFWRQLMLWLMSREESSDDAVYAEMDLRRFETDASPGFFARVQSTSEQGSQSKLTAFVVDSEGKERKLDVTASVGGPSQISGRMPDMDPGFYELLVRSADERIKESRVAFQVTDTSLEMGRPMADPIYMSQLAQLTSDHGGAAIDPQDVDELLDVITEKRRKAETPVIDKRRLGDGPMSGALVFVLFVGALTAEWLLRRKWGLA